MSITSDQVLNIAVNYLGPAARQFLDRQCRAHLDLEFDDLTIEDIQELAKWIETSAGIIIDQREAVQLASEVSDLAYLRETA